MVGERVRASQTSDSIRIYDAARGEVHAGKMRRFRLCFLEFKELSRRRIEDWTVTNGHHPSITEV
jgi:hypothetical protein